MDGLNLNWRKRILFTSIIAIFILLSIHLQPINSLLPYSSENYNTSEFLYYPQKMEVPDVSFTPPHVYPNQSYGEIEVNHSFKFKKWKLTITERVNRSIYEGAKKGTGKCTAIGGAHDEVNQDFITARTRLGYINEPHQKEFYKSLTNNFKSYKKRYNLTDDEYLELIVAFVQSIPYDHEKASAIESPNKKAEPRFPIETFVDMNGTCGDTSMLLVGLLAEEGYDVALLDFKKENHMTVGVRIPDTQNINSGYEIVESTMYNFIGVEPELIFGGKELHSTPQVIKVGNGTKTYNSVEQTMKIREALIFLNKKTGSGIITNENEYYHNAWAYIVKHRYNREGVYDWIQTQPPILISVSECPFLQLIKNTFYLCRI